MEPERTVHIDFRRPLPIVPLPETVLLPWGLLPLEVFEPRDWRMAADVLDGHGLIATAVIDRTADAGEVGGPPLRPFACVGYCIDHERLSDGRSFLMLQGVARTRIIREGSHEPYRTAWLSPTESAPLPDERLAEERQRLRTLLGSPRLAGVDGVDRARTLLDEAIPTAGGIDAAIMSLSGDPEERYQMLRQPDARARAAWLEQWLIEAEEERKGDR